MDDLQISVKFGCPRQKWQTGPFHNKKTKIQSQRRSKKNIKCTIRNMFETSNFQYEAF